MRGESENSTNSWKYKFFVGVGYAGISTLFLYEAFNLEAGHDGLITLNDLLFDEESSWVNYLAWIISGAVVLLETGTNISIVDPEHEAKRILEIDEDEPAAKSLLEPVITEGVVITQPKPQLISFTPKGLVSLTLVLTNCAVVGVSSMIPIHTVMGRTPLSLTIMVPMSLLSFVYQLLLGAADTVEAYAEMSKGGESVYSKLWQLSPSQFVRCTVEGFVMTNIYFSVIAAYILQRVFDGIFDYPEIVEPLQLFSFAAVAYSLTPRHERLYKRYLEPFSNGRGGYDLNAITLEDRVHAWGNLTRCEKSKFCVSASLYSALVMGVSLYFSDKYLAPMLNHDHQRTILNTAVASTLGPASFGFVLSTNWQYMMNELSHAAKAHTKPVFSEEGYSFGTKAVATAFNLGSQLTRGICMITFFVSVLGKYFPDVDLLMMCLIVAITVGSTNFAYYQPKLLRRLDDWEHSLFHRASSTVTPDEEGEPAGYLPLAGNEVTGNCDLPQRGQL